MLFETRFEVVEIRNSGARITHYLRGKKKDVKKDIEQFKKRSKDYMMVSKNAMIVWVD